MPPPVIPVILSGGAGTRLWPASIPERPKPFLAMPDGETLLEKTLGRARAIAGDGPILTVTGAGYFEMTRAEYRRAGTVADEQLHYLLEPAPRNTAPAVAAAMGWIGDRFGGDAVALVMPADHLIGDLDAFRTAVRHAADLASQDLLATFGVVPERPETGYGYIQAGRALDGGFEVARFVEKPPEETARQYIDSGEYLWNCGIFCFTPDTFGASLSQVDPGFAGALHRCLGASDLGGRVARLEAESFRRLTATSLDYALMEKSGNVAVVPVSMGWSDVGTWSALAEMAETDEAGNFGAGHVLFEGATDCFVQTRDVRPVAVIGARDLMIVDAGHALLVCRRDRAQDVRKVVDRLSRSVADPAPDGDGSVDVTPAPP